jgi:hypothetical protein
VRDSGAALVDDVTADVAVDVAVVDGALAKTA